MITDQIRSTVYLIDPGTALAEHLRVELGSPTRMSFRKVRTGRKFDSQTTE